MNRDCLIGEFGFIHPPVILLTKETTFLLCKLTVTTRTVAANSESLVVQNMVQNSVPGKLICAWIRFGIPLVRQKSADFWDMDTHLTRVAWMLMQRCSTKKDRSHPDLQRSTN